MSDGPVVRTDFDYVDTVMNNLQSKIAALALQMEKFPGVLILQVSFLFL